MKKAIGIITVFIFVTCTGVDCLCMYYVVTIPPVLSIKIVGAACLTIQIIINTLAIITQFKKLKIKTNNLKK